MVDIATIYEQASERKQHPDYAGEVSADESWNILSAEPSAALVDVRTLPEWQFAGLPDLSSLNKETHQISWKTYPSFETNQSFVKQLSNKIQDANTPILFLCKSGARSLDAAIAMTQAGYTHCFNIIDGFEGPKNDAGQRGSVAGWKASQHPWEQA